MLLSFLISFPLFLLALVVHEYAHGWVAYKLGDSTAKNSGRLTFNPIAHIDPIGTIILPVLLLLMKQPAFGWAKPVPINFSSLRNPKRDMFWVGLAGPAANFLFAIILVLIVKLPISPSFNMLKFFLSQMVFINILLGVLNLFPLPPLDGSRLLFSILPDELAYQYIKLERYGMFILIGLMYMGIMDKFIWPLVLAIMKLFNM